MGSVIDLPFLDRGYSDETLSDRLLTRFGVWASLCQRDPFGPILQDEVIAQFLETGSASQYFSDVTERRSVYGMLRPASDVVPEQYDMLRLHGRDLMIKSVKQLPDRWGVRPMFEVHCEG